MGYTVAGDAGPVPLQRLVDELRAALARAGFEPAGEGEPPELVLNLIDPERPRPFRRGSKGTFVAALHALDEPPADPLREGYPMLVRALANLSLTYVPSEGVWFTTIERGSYLVPAANGATALADAVVSRLAPLARSRLVIENDFRTDLEPELWAGDEITAVDRRGRPPPRRARPPAGAVPDRGARSASATSGTSSGSTGSAASRTGTSRRARTPTASG